jgi:hypothetical protein
VGRTRPARLIRAAAVLAASILLGACGSNAASGGPQPSSSLQAQVVASELLVGAQQRVPIGILDHNTPVSDATLRVRSFILSTDGNVARYKGESGAPFRGAGLEGGGVYVAHLDFDTPGNWGVDITATRPNGQRGSMRLPLNVIANPVVPAVGQPAPPSHNPTVRDVPDLGYIDSGQPPNDMHQLSIAQAVQQHRRTLVVFASPAFCTSRICGPEVKVVQRLEPAYKERLSFIHVEVYADFKPDPSKRQLAQTVLDWRLQTEPWIFLIDSTGKIQARFEGPTDSDELQAAIDRLLA